MRKKIVVNWTDIYNKDHETILYALEVNESKIEDFLQQKKTFQRLNNIIVVESPTRVWQ